MLQRADSWWHKNRRLMASAEVRCQRPPSEYFHDNVRLTFMEDRSAILAREVIGTNTLMWGNDFPHHNSTWPNSRQILEDALAGVPEVEQHMIINGNVRALYNL
jgi:uncharacterized protein